MPNQFAEFFSISVHVFSCSHFSRSKSAGEDPGFFCWRGGGGGGGMAGWLACTLGLQNQCGMFPKCCNLRFEI